MDAFILPIVMVVISYFVTKSIEGAKRDNELLKKAGLNRFESYKKLWEMSDVSLYIKEDAVDKNKLLDDLTSWYYQEGNGLWIYIGSSDLLLSLINQLKRNAEITDSNIIKRLSKLRTQLKADVKTYTRIDVFENIGNK